MPMCTSWACRLGSFLRPRVARRACLEPRLVGCRGNRRLSIHRRGLHRFSQGRTEAFKKFQHGSRMNGLCPFSACWILRFLHVIIMGWSWFQLLGCCCSPVSDMVLISNMTGKGTTFQLQEIRMSGACRCPQKFCVGR